MYTRSLNFRSIFAVLVLAIAVLTACAPSTAPTESFPPSSSASTPVPTLAPAQAPTNAPASAPTSMPPAAASGAVGLKLAQNSTLGSFLADGQGRTLYLFMKDTKNTSNCYDACAAKWPPLVSADKPALGEGIKADLVGTTQRKDGSAQITYNGWPLYYYAPDQQPGDTKGQGVGNVWYVLTAAGEAFTGGAAPALAPTAAPTEAPSPYKY